MAVKDSDFDYKADSIQEVNPKEGSKTVDSAAAASDETTGDETQVADTASTFETVAPGLSELEEDSVFETINSIAAQLNEDKIETWINLWDLLDKNENLRNGLDTIKASLNVAITAVENVVKTLKAAVKIALAFAGSVIAAINSAIMVLKTIIKSLKKILGMLEDFLEIDLFKAELKVASFSFIPNLNAEILKQGNMAPLVNSKLNDMTNEWFNHPEVEDGLCATMFIPIAVPKELTQVVASCIKLKDLIQEWIKNLKNLKKEEAPDVQFVRGDFENLVGLFNWLYIYDSSLGRNIGDLPESVLSGDFDTFEEIKSAVLDMAIVAVDKLTDTEKEYLALLFSSQMTYIDIAMEGTVSTVASGAFESDGIQGVVDYRAYVDIKKTSTIILETNFKSDQYRFLSAAYKISAGGDPELIFSNPSIKVMRVLATSEIKDRLDSLGKVYLSYSRWYRRGGSRPRENVTLIAAVSQLFNRLMPDRFGDLESSFVLPADKLVFMSLADAQIQEYSQNNKDPFGTKAYDKALKKINGSVDPSVRTSVRKNERLFSSTIKFESQGDINTDEPGPDRLILLFEDSETIILNKSFVKEGMNNSRQTRAGLFAGEIDAVDNTLPAVVTIRPKTDEGMQPRWYGVGGSNSSGSWTGNKLAQMLLPDSVLESVDLVYDTIDNIDKALDEALEGTDELTEKLRAIEKEVDEFFGILENIIALVRKLVNSLSLTQLPAIYTAFWRGSSKELPGVLMGALSQKNWSTSTYAGLIVFGSSDAAAAILEGYKIAQKATEEYESLEQSIPNKMKAAGEGMNQAAENFEKVKDAALDVKTQTLKSVKELTDLRISIAAEKKEKGTEIIEDPAEAYYKLIELRPVMRRATEITAKEDSKIKDSTIDTELSEEE